MGGLLTGIMLARPLANAIAAALGWRAVFGLSAGAMALIGGILWRVLPTYRPEGQLRYGDRSGLFTTHRRRTCLSVVTPCAQDVMAASPFRNCNPFYGRGCRALRPPNAGSISLALGNPFIAQLKRIQREGQPIRALGPERHILEKAGTPTMGGMLIDRGAACGIAVSHASPDRASVRQDCGFRSGPGGQCACAFARYA